jgi:hypothetical protein
MIGSQAPRDPPSGSSRVAVSVGNESVPLETRPDLGSGTRDIYSGMADTEALERDRYNNRVRRHKEAIDGFCMNEACDPRPRIALWPWWGSRQRRGSHAGDEMTMRLCKRRQHFRRGVTGISRICGQTKGVKIPVSRYFPICWWAGLVEALGGGGLMRAPGTHARPSHLRRAPLIGAARQPSASVSHSHF